MRTSRIQTALQLALPLILGVLCGLCRGMLLQDGYAALAGRQHALLPVYLLITACMLVFLAMSVVLGRKKLLCITESVPTAKRMLYVISALMLFAAAVLVYLQNIGMLSILKIVQLLFLALCGFSVFLRAKDGDVTENSGVFSLFPVYYLCLYLLLLYRQNARDANTETFALELLCVVVLILGVYHISVRKFEGGKRRRYLFFCMAALFWVPMIDVTQLVAGGAIPARFALSDLVALTAFALLCAAALLWPVSQVTSIDPDDDEDELLELLDDEEFSDDTDEDEE